MYFRRLTYGFVFSPLMSAFAAAAMGVSAANVVHVARTADLVDFSASLERGAAPDRDYLTTFVSQSAAMIDASDCADLASRARLTVALAALQAVDRAGDASKAAYALEGALSAARARIQCSAMDGNAWLRWAQLTLRASGANPEVISAVKLSFLFAPSEAWIVAPRLDLEADIAKSEAALNVSLVEDLRQFVTFQGAGAVGAAYVGHTGKVRETMRRFIETQAVSRRRAIIAEIDRLGVDYAKP